VNPIPDIGTTPIKPISVPEVHTWAQHRSLNIPAAPPVVVEIGVPVINMPGCITAHEKSDKSTTISSDDPNGVRVFCDAGMPSYTPIDYNPEEMILTQPAPIPQTPQQKKPDKPLAPDDIPLPAPPVSATTQGGDNVNPSCEPYCDNPATIQTTTATPPKEPAPAYLPELSAVTTTAAIAVVATSSALLAKPLADLLLKLVKPTVKKVQKKLFALLKKPQKVESVMERRLAQRDRNRALLALRRALKK